MQVNKSSLKQRVITALVLAPPVMAAVLLLPTALFASMLAIVVGLGAWEWAKLAGLSSPRAQQTYVALVVFFLGFVWFLQDWQEGVLLLLLLALAWWLVAAVWVIRYPASATAWSTAVWRRGVIGFLVLIPAWAALVVLHGHGEQGPRLVLLVMLLIWGADSGAYFAGRKWGRDKLAPFVSPGKSWQGLWGGLAAALLIAVLFTDLFSIRVDYHFYFITICIITAIFSVLGDLVESMFKREAGIKDSSNLLPGHGGMLDRIDSFTAAAPVFTLGTLGVCL